MAKHFEVLGVEKPIAIDASVHISFPGDDDRGIHQLQGPA